MRSNSGYRISVGLVILIILLLAANLLVGTVDIPAASVARILFADDQSKASWHFIIWESRFPMAITALLSGMALAVSGLMLQTVFSNPLADPSILGITSGAGLGVAIVLLTGGMAIGMGAFNLSGMIAALFGAFIGAGIVLSLILLLSTLIRSNTMLLIAGIMIGYLISSLIALLNFFATAEGLHSFTAWGLGNFGGVSLAQLPFYTTIILTGLILAILLIKPLNAMLLGTRYAENLGVNIRRVRFLLLVATGLLTAVVTAFCGPIAFIGLSVPHIARLTLGSSNHNKLMPVTILIGGVIALLCNLLCILPRGLGILPLNAVTPIIGAPVIIYVIINRKKIQYFN